MERRNEVVDIFQGIFLVFSLHIAGFGILFIIVSIVSIIFGRASEYVINSSAFSVLFIGISQLVYVIPTIILLTRQQRWGLMKGVIIGAVITALLNGCGYWWLFSNLSY